MNILEEQVYLQKITDDFDELRLSVARIETTFASAQERFYEKMVEISNTMQSIILVSNKLDQLDAKHEENIAILSGTQQEYKNKIASIIVETTKIPELMQAIHSLRIRLFIKDILMILIFMILLYHIIFE